MSSSSASATVAVHKATSDLLLGPDWTINMEICDSVNSLHWQAKDVVKALKKRLQHKSPRVQLLALTLLETLVKNCGDYLHHQVAEKNLLGEMVKIVKKKADMQVRDKILVLLDSWQQAFGGPEGRYPQYYSVYDELRRSGVSFPRRSPDASPPIITPPVSHPPLRLPQEGYGVHQTGYGIPQAGHGIPQVGYGMPNSSARRLDEAMATEVEGLSISRLESMRDVMDLMSDMLQAVDPSDREAVKDEVIVDLVEHCRSNQKMLMQMLTSTGDDELLGRALDLNDSLQIVLAKHDAIASGSALPAQALKPAESIPESSEAKDSTSVTGSSSPLPAIVSTSKSPIDEECEEEEDEFVQLARRHSKLPASITGESISSESHNTASNALALALPDPPPPVNTTKEQDIIDLLSITLSTPSTPPPPSSQPSPPPPPLTVSDQNYPQPSPQFSSYVAPWAQPQPHSHQAYSQQHQRQQSYSQPQSQTPFQMQPQTRPQNPYEYPPPPWASTSANAYYTPRANASASYTDTSGLAGRSLQQSNSFPARTGDSQATSTASNPGVAVGQKLFVPSSRLFEDLDVFRSADGKHNKTANNSNGSQNLSGSHLGVRKVI